MNGKVRRPNGSIWREYSLAAMHVKLSPMWRSNLMRLMRPIERYDDDDDDVLLMFCVFFFLSGICVRAVHNSVFINIPT